MLKIHEIYKMERMRPNVLGPVVTSVLRVDYF